MSSHNRNNPAVPGRALSASKTGRAESEQNPLHVILRILRGRAIAAVVLAVVLGLAGAVAGFSVLQPEYESVAMISIAPILPKVLYESETNNMLPMFGAFVDTQIAQMESRRVIDLALTNEAWQEFSVDGPYTVQEFSERLTVWHPRDSQLVLVAFRDPLPARARAGADAVVKSYFQIYNESDKVKEAERLGFLQERSVALSAEIAGYADDILNIGHEFGTDNLRDFHTFQVEQLQELETALRRAKIDLANLVPSDESPEDRASSVANMSIDEIAAVDIRMQHLIDERDAIRVQIEDIEQVHKNPESSTKRNEYRSLVSRLNYKESDIQKHARTFRETYVPDNTTAPTIDHDGFLVAPPDPERTRATVERLQALYEQQRKETLELGRKSLQVERLKAEMASAQTSLEQVNRRIEQLSVESSVGGRVKLFSEPETPVEPSNAKRKTQFTILGGFGGSGVAVALVVLVGLINPRVRFISDAEEVRPRLLGAFPELPNKLDDATEAMVAAQCVHQVRNMVQTATHSQNGLVIAITSATSGTGKSSAAMSLGLSFAAAGNRTLLVDGDVVGMGLTSLASEAEKEGFGANVTTQNGGSNGSSAEAKHSTADSVAQALVKLYEDDERRTSKNCHWGLAGALEGEDFDNCTLDLGVPNLTFLPACGHMRAPINIMSRRVMKSFIDELRNNFEVIIIDTGPVPGPSDSSIMAAVVDAVLMMVSRGESNNSVRQAIQHLDLIQAPLVGMVFNRARANDLEASGHSSTQSSKLTVYSEAVRAECVQSFARREDFAHFGPLPQAVWAMSIGQRAYPDAVIID